MVAIQELTNEVYPRPRGGTPSPSGSPAHIKGLSPPTRGNQHSEHGEGARQGSIPAHAGEPASRPAASPETTVYPRPRGGTARSSPVSENTVGLSPPTRGNPYLDPREIQDTRSIPAHAGEPCALPPVFCTPKVYPRPRGGTDGMSQKEVGAAGLSPPTRGNQWQFQSLSEIHGSIPAHAGEPVVFHSLALRMAVYPRPRGGTDSCRKSCKRARGLSPPTRGNPDKRGGGGVLREVYPRPRGGTSLTLSSLAPPPGLSPPTRGNLQG